jgi:ABC-2 type transport system ATP-binding protein
MTSASDPWDHGDATRRTGREPCAVQLCDLSKRFGAVHAVDRVSAAALPGQVTALLGPNGAGKTTILRMLLGLVAPSSGTATFGGQRYDELTDPARRVGAVLEASGWHPGRAARDHLRILATASRLPADAPLRVVAATGLADAARRRVGEFSLGMRQRLGLAAAMLGDPDILVLDEPTNGLDPPGMRWLREHLRRLADQGRTVLMSSHALGEVEQIADHVLVLAHGHLLRSARLTELAAEAGVGSRIRTPQPDRLLAALQAAGHRCSLVDDDLIVDAAPEQVGELAARHGLVLHRLIPTMDLEHVFFRLISESNQAQRLAPAERIPS